MICVDGGLNILMIIACPKHVSFAVYSMGLCCGFLPCTQGTKPQHTNIACRGNGGCTLPAASLIKQRTSCILSSEGPFPILSLELDFFRICVNQSINWCAEQPRLPSQPSAAERSPAEPDTPTPERSPPPVRPHMSVATSQLAYLFDQLCSIHKVP